MANIPMEALTARQKRTTMILKLESVRRALKDLRLGGSPENSPPLPNLVNTIPTNTEAPPNKAITPRQENHPKKASATRGATTKPKLGASSWMATALPQCLEATMEVRVAIPEGR